MEMLDVVDFSTRRVFERTQKALSCPRNDAAAASRLHTALLIETILSRTAEKNGRKKCAIAQQLDKHKITFSRTSFVQRGLHSAYATVPSPSVEISQACGLERLATCRLIYARCRLAIQNEPRYLIGSEKCLVEWRACVVHVNLRSRAN